MTTQLTLHPYAPASILMGKIKTGNIFKAVGIAASDPVVWASNAFSGVTTPPILWYVDLVIDLVMYNGYSYLTCAPFTLTASSNIPTLGAILILGSSDGSGFYNIGHLLTGPITSLATGESITVDFGDTPVANAMLKLMNT